MPHSPSFPFATLASLKSRIGLTQSDLDFTLADFLRTVSAAMEAYVGRRLRRDRPRKEIFTGGCPTIRVAVSPIVKIIHIRESDTRDFETSDNYEELVEGTDYVLESTTEGEEPGNSGVIRRIGGNWNGGKKNPGTVQVAYIGGLKTEDEEALENRKLTISGDLNDFGISKLTTVTPPYYYVTDESTNGLILISRDDEGLLTYAVFRYDTSEIILPTWSVTDLTFYVWIKHLGAGPDMYVMPRVIGIDGLSQDFPALFSAIGSGTGLVQNGFYVPVSSTSLFQAAAHMNLQAEKDAIQENILNGRLSIGLDVLTNLGTGYAADITNADPSKRPSLVVQCRAMQDDHFVVHHDLVHACLMQTTHEYQTRLNPGIRAEGQRGITLTSGSTIQKSEATLLPEVKMILDQYKRLY